VSAREPIEQYLGLVPELLKTEHAKLLQTLKSLGLRSSDQALRKGHVCVREARGGAYRTIAGLWVAHEDLPAFASAAQALLDAKATEQEQRKHELEVRFESDLGTPLATLTEPVRHVVRQALYGAKSLAAGQSAAVRALLGVASAEVQARVYERQGEFRLRCEFESAGEALEGSVPLTPRQACLFVLGDEAARVRLTAALGKKFGTEFVRLQERWFAERPSWFDEAMLKRWALGHATRHPSATHEHPLRDWFDRAPAQAGHAGLKLEGKGTRRSRFVRGPLCLGEHRLKISQPWDLDELTRRLWAQKDALTPLAAFESAAQQYLASRQQQLDDLVRQFEATLAWGPRQEQLGLSPQQWRDLLHEALRTHCAGEIRGNPRESKAWANARRQVEAELVRHARQHAAEKLRRELPARLEDFYPVARSLGRKLVLVVGPTNSGKTHRALERLRAAETGAYLGPLRLLALEVRDRLQEAGTPTSLVTGELIEEVPGARHTAATVEMLDFEQVLDVAVIDEVQMLADAQRGFAWLQAVLGAPAREVWLLGAPEARDAVEYLATRLGESLEVIETERLAPLTADNRPTKLKDVAPQSAVIAFSRRDVLDLAGELREAHGRTVAVLYGALSPEVRREQARLFASGQADVVVATDAIGMGLNLPIRHVYFSTDEKFNGQSRQRVPRTLFWQIAGRAGRFGLHEVGRVGALDSSTLQSVRKALARAPDAVARRFRYAPSWPVVQRLAHHLATEHLPTLLAFFRDELRLGDTTLYAPSLGEDQLTLAHATARLALPLQEQLMLSSAPVPLDKGEVPGEFLRFAQALAQRQPFAVSELKSLQAQYTDHDAERAERAVKLLNLYCWLHYRAPEVFAEREAAMNEIAQLNAAISKHLGRTRRKRCGECGQQMPWQHAFRICESCYQERRSYARHGFGYGGFDWD
jgi:hypothetical protein